MASQKFFKEPVTYSIVLEKRDVQLLRALGARRRRHVSQIVRDALMETLREAERIFGRTIPQKEEH